MRYFAYVHVLGSLSKTPAYSYAEQTISSSNNFLLEQGARGGITDFSRPLVVTPSRTLLGVLAWLGIVRSGVPPNSPCFT